MKAKEQIKKHLIDLNQETSSILDNLLSRQVTSTTPMDKEDVILWIDDKPFLTKKDVSFITGQAGTGKSFLRTLLVAQMLAPNEEKFKSDLKEDETIAWFDTEQKKNHTIKITKRINAMGDESRVSLFEQRSVTSPKERYEEFKAYLKEYSPAVVIIDGLTDYMADSLDLVESSQLMGEILELSSAHNCCIIAIIHQNESGGMQGSKKVRGHVGSEGTRKGENVIGIELGNEQFNVKRLKSRNEPWKEWSFKIENKGSIALPRVLSDSERKQTPSEAARALSERLKQDYNYAHTVFTEITIKHDNPGKAAFAETHLIDWAKFQSTDDGVTPIMSRSMAREIYAHWEDKGNMFKTGPGTYGKTIIVDKEQKKLWTGTATSTLIEEDDVPF